MVRGLKEHDSCLPASSAGAGAEIQVPGKGAHPGTWGGRGVSKPANEIGAESWLQE